MLCNARNPKTIIMRVRLKIMGSIAEQNWHYGTELCVPICPNSVTENAYTSSPTRIWNSSDSDVLKGKYYACWVEGVFISADGKGCKVLLQDR